MPEFWSVDHDPFAPQFQPVDHDPFSVQFQPVDHDPFSIASMTHGAEKPPDASSRAAKGIIDTGAAFASSGLQGIANQWGINTPDWTRKLGAAMSGPEVNAALGVVGGPAVPSIRAAAYKIGDKIYKAPNHVLAMDKAVKDLGVGSYADLIDLQGGFAGHHAGDGFITSEGKFVSRDEAKSIAENAGQGKATADQGIKAEDMRMQPRTSEDVLPSAIGPKFSK